MTDQTEVRKRSVFISTVHGGTEEDIVEVYCDMVLKKIEEMVSDLTGDIKKKKRASLLLPLRGGMVGGKYQGGILPSTSYVCYAIKDGVIGRLELYSTWMKRIEELNIDEDVDEEAAIDRFSDPDNGVSLIITKQKRSNRFGYDYILSKREFSPNRYKNWDDFMEKERVTDAQLKELFELTPLEDMLGGDVYRRKDFLMALDGLRRFDKEYDYGVFDSDEFQNKILEFDVLFPEEDDDEVESVHEDSSIDVQGEDFSQWKLPKLRKYIQDYINTNYPGEKLPALPLETLIEWAVLVEQEDALPFEDTIEESTSEQVIDKEKPTPEVPSITKEAEERINRLKQIRKRRE
jgi:hypothetical protein